MPLHLRVICFWLWLCFRCGPLRAYRVANFATAQRHGLSGIARTVERVPVHHYHQIPLLLMDQRFEHLPRWEFLGKLRCRVYDATLPSVHAMDGIPKIPAICMCLLLQPPPTSLLLVHGMALEQLANTRGSLLNCLMTNKAD